jgi:hypothetical protein
MIELSFTETISRPRTDVFSILTDFERYLAQWAKGVRAENLVQVMRPGDIR